MLDTEEALKTVKRARDLSVENDLKQTKRTRKEADEKQGTTQKKICPYLGTINRHVLDFDFEKLCSITLSNQRPYGCLVCGKYFQGRGITTNAMTHALETQHYLYINLLDARIYCLPENFEVDDASLDDIKKYVDSINTVPRFGKALDGADFIPGCVGLNNLGQTDYFNVIVQILCTVIPFRSHFLLADLSHVQTPNPVHKTLSDLFKKIFNPQNFKGVVSPHEFLQGPILKLIALRIVSECILELKARTRLIHCVVRFIVVADASQKRFRIGVQQDPSALLAWLFRKLHLPMRKKTNKKSIIQECFQGKLLVSTSKVVGPDMSESDPVDTKVPFLFLTIDVPPAPIFRDSMDKNAIPQLPIFELLQKFDGSTAIEAGTDCLKRHSIWKLPPYLLVHVNRFSKNNFFLEKNPTIVTFPIKSLDLTDYIHPDACAKNPRARYDLVANVVHEGHPTTGKFKCQVYHAPTKAWYEIEDLRVTPTLPQMVALSESYIQLYQRQDVQPNGESDENYEPPHANNSNYSNIEDSMFFD